LEWTGEGQAEKGIEKKTGKVRVEVDPRFYRPTEVDLLLGNAAKAAEVLGWEPATKFEKLVKLMVQSDWDKVRKRGY